MKKVTIGNTTLYCGDCFDILPKLDLEADAVICDPPYGTTNCKWDWSIPLDSLWTMLDHRTKQSANFVFFGCGKFTIDLIQSKYRWFRYDLIWVKTKKCGFLNANLQPMRNHESILVFGRPGYQKVAVYNPQKLPGGRAGIRQTKRRGGVYRAVDGGEKYYDGMQHPCSVLQFKSEKNKGFHPTLKPVTLMEHLVKSYSDDNEVILDMFMGSGSTGIAAINTGRRFIGIEQNAEYFTTACKRIAEAYAERKDM